MEKNINRFKSVLNFKREIKETVEFVKAFNSHLFATKALLDVIDPEKGAEYAKVKKYFEVSEKQIDKLYELGFVALFANFECFMFEFLKELFIKYPGSLKLKKIVKFEDIKDLDNMREVKSYFVDACAIEESYDIKTWENFLLSTFNIKIFKKAGERDRFLLLNSLRNIYMHSGGKTNSKFANEVKPFIKSKIPLGRITHFDKKKFFSILYKALLSIVEDVEGVRNRIHKKK